MENVGQNVAPGREVEHRAFSKTCRKVAFLAETVTWSKDSDGTNTSGGQTRDIKPASVIYISIYKYVYIKNKHLLDAEEEKEIIAEFLQIKGLQSRALSRNSAHGIPLPLLQECVKNKSKGQHGQPTIQNCVTSAEYGIYLTDRWAEPGAR